MHALRSIAILAVLAVPAAAADGDTRIATWKDDKDAAIVLMFDDSCVSHVKHAIPEMQRRGLTGTFYINQGSGHYAAHRQFWDKDVPAAGFELANHTLTHKGGATVADVTREIVGANEAIRAATPSLKWPRLVSWGQPGGIKKEMWPISKDELAAVLRENHLVPRPDFGGRGAAIAFKSGEQYVAHVDKAIASGAMECIIYHGVGGDWLSAPLQDFTVLLDALVARADKVWVTGHIPAHQYAVQRDAATVAVTAASPTRITVTLGCTADPAFYDHPLTLVTRVPAAWKWCIVTQGKRSVEVAVDDGAVRYEALPGAEPIVLTRK